MTMINLVYRASGAAMLLGACQLHTTPDEAGPAIADPTQAVLSGEACPDIGDRAYFFWMQPRSAEPGDQIALFPYWTDMPGSYNDLPAGCLDELDVYPEGAATFTRQEDGLALATISAETDPGTMVLLNGTYRGHSLTGRVDIYKAEANPLVGTWRQDGSGCPPESAVRELVFTGGNEITVTWTPFEVYKDYWGRYTYDADTGAFSFEVEGGNQFPDDMVTAGHLRIEGDRLVAEDVFLGTPRQAAGPCQGDFTR